MRIFLRDPADAHGHPVHKMQKLVLLVDRAETAESKEMPLFMRFGVCCLEISDLQKRQQSNPPLSASPESNPRRADNHNQPCSYTFDFFLVLSVQPLRLRMSF